MNIDITFLNISKEAHASTRAYLEQLVERHMQPDITTFNLKTAVEPPVEWFDCGFQVESAHGFSRAT